MAPRATPLPGPYRVLPCLPPLDAAEPPTLGRSLDVPSPDRYRRGSPPPPPAPAIAGSPGVRDVRDEGRNTSRSADDFAAGGITKADVGDDAFVSAQEHEDRVPVATDSQAIGAELGRSIDAARRGREEFSGLVVERPAFGKEVHVVA